MYTSIYDAVNARHADGRLFLHQTEAQPGVQLGIPRTMYTCYEINELLCGSDPLWKIHVAAVLDQFVDGGMIRLRREGRGRFADRGLTADMVQLEADPGDPPEIWEIRSVEPDPQIRILGSFGAPGFFLALTWHERGELDTAAKWRAAMLECADLWNELFFACEPHSGEYPDGYLSTTEFVP